MNGQWLVPEEYHKSLDKGLEMNVSVVLGFRIEVDVPKNLKKLYYIISYYVTYIISY